MRSKYRLPRVLTLLRHAQSERNAAKGGDVHLSPDRRAASGVHLIPDHRIALSPHGHKQAEAVGRHFEQTETRFDRVYHSGYTRAIQTAQIALHGGIIRRPPVADYRVRERDHGYGYPMTEEEHTAAFPYMDGYYQTFGRLFARPVGGESLIDVVARVDAFLRDLGRWDGSVLVVTHAGTIACFRYLLEGWTYAEFEEKDKICPPNCAMVRYYRGDLVDANYTVPA